jgi:ABC-2 type transport system permease protein
MLDGLLSGSGSLQDQFIAVVLEMFSMVAAGYALLTVLALLAEERGGRAEALLATPVNRTRWASSHLLFAILNPAIITAVFGTAVGLVHGMSTGDLSEQLTRILGAALVRLPVIWWFAGVAFALFAIRPKTASSAFAVLAGSLLILGLGIQLHLSPWILNLSPFAHVPELPGGELHLSPLLAMTLFTAGLTAIGIVFLRRRDLPAA